MTSRARMVFQRVVWMILMIRCFRNRQLIIFADYYGRKAKQEGAYNNLRNLLDQLWRNRDQVLVSPEGDQATGRQLINNVLASKCGDEGLCGLGTEGLQQLYADFDRRIRLWERDGERPFRHIKAWYNMIGYAGLDYRACYAASQEDVVKHGRHKLPSNTQCIGVDVYPLLTGDAGLLARRVGQVADPHVQRRRLQPVRAPERPAAARLERISRRGDSARAWPATEVIFLVGSR